MKITLSKVIDTILTLAGFCIVIFGIRESKTWEWWQWDRWPDLGKQEITRPSLKSLKAVFSNPELAQKLRRSDSQIAVYARDEPEGSHRHNFSFPIRISWFLLPDARQLPLVHSAEEAQAFDWIIDTQSRKDELETGQRTVIEHWAKDELYLYELGAKNKKLIKKGQL